MMMNYRVSVRYIHLITIGEECWLWITGNLLLVIALCKLDITLVGSSLNKITIAYFKYCVKTNVNIALSVTRGGYTVHEEFWNFVFRHIYANCG